MTRGRKRMLAPVTVAGNDLNLEVLEADNAASQALAVADMAVVNASPALIAIGRLQTADFFRHVADVVAAQVFVDLRESKQFNNLAYRAPDGSVRRVGTIEEFCEHFLGKSRKRMYELASNLDLLGSELYEQAERSGFRARDYRALKALPRNDQELVKQAIESGGDNKQTLLLLNELAARVVKLTEAHRRELQEKDKVIQDKTEKINQLATDLSLEQRQSTKEELAAHQLAEMAKVRDEFHAVARRMVSVHAQTLADPASIVVSDEARRSVEACAQHLAGLFAEAYVRIDFVEMVNPS